MNTASQLSRTIQDILAQPAEGIAGMVDGLLAACPKNGLQIEWQADHFCFRSLDGDREEWTEVPLRKSVFRAILARLAVLCNEQTPYAISPYGGRCELSASGDSRARLRITFSNTPDEQKLELMPGTVATTEASSSASSNRDCSMEGRHTVERT